MAGDKTAAGQNACPTNRVLIEGVVKVEISKQVKGKICKLALQGKPCSKIQCEDCPDLTWWDVREVLEEAGTSSSRGLMQEISNKLRKAGEKAKKDKKLSDDLSRVHKLARQLYNRGKEDYQKLKKISKAIESW